MPEPGGYNVAGNASEASLDQVNIWMRSTPWYQEMMRAWGQDPGHPSLNDAQRQAITREAQKNGVVVHEGDVEIDKGGNFDTRGHGLRNTLIVAGIAAASIATMGAAGAFAGAAGAGTGAAGAGGAAGGTLAATTTAPLMGMLPAGGVGLGAGGSAAALGGGAAATAGGWTGGAAGGHTAGGTLAAGGGLSATDRLLKAGKALSMAAPIVGALRYNNNNQNNAPDANQMIASNPQLKQLFDLQVGQAQRADPMHEALVRLSTRLLPNSAKSGGY